MSNSVPAIKSGARPAPARPTRPPRRWSGATLPELVITLMILCVMAAIAIPRLSNAWRRARLELAARRVSTDLRFVRQQSIGQKCTCGIAFDTAAQTYERFRIRQDTSRETLGAVEFGRPPHENIRIQQADFGGQTEVRFGPLGLPEVSGTVTITDGIEKVVLTLDAATGWPRSSIAPVAAP